MFMVNLSEDKRKVMLRKVRQDKVDIYFEWKKWANGQKTNISNFSKVANIIDWRLEVSSKEADSLENIYKELKIEIRELMSKQSWMWKYVPFFLIKKKFKQSIIIRLPNLYGNGLKKNFIYDLIYRNRWDLTHKDSKMQWYNLKHIWKDILIVKENMLSVVNFAVAPVSVKKIAKYSLDIAFTNITEKEPLNHRMLTVHSKIFGKKNGFLYSQKQTLEELKDFITHQK
jgi:hypothetical protein